MSKLFTVDDKLLTDRPEIRIGKTCYPVDDRKKTMEKIVALEAKSDNGLESADKIIELALGTEAAEEIQKAEYSFAVHMQLVKFIVAAVTGEDPEGVAERFQKEEDLVK